jgi:hypothetical protein
MLQKLNGWAAQADHRKIPRPYARREGPAQLLKHSVAVVPRNTAAWVPLRHSLVIVLVAALLCAPCLLVGIPAGMDAPTHVIYQYYFSHQFWSGDFYPRWLAEANKGYGSPVFLIQYPLPYVTTALLRPITLFPASATREAQELGVYCFLVFAAAGLAARGWFRNRCSPVASTIAAVVYISLPYILGQGLYGRGAIGELTAFVWMPLALALCDRAEPNRLGVLSAISMVFALLLLSNFLCAVLFAPVMLIYVMGKCGDMPLVRRIAPVLFALAIGIGVAAVYLFPLVTNRNLFNFVAVNSHHPQAEFGRNFLMASASDISSSRTFIPGMFCAICLTLVVARYVWRADAGFVSRLVMLLTLGLGVLMVFPDLGPRVVETSGFKTTGFGTNAVSMRMLFVSLYTIALGLLAYCRVAKAGTDGREERLLLLVSCGLFVLMLPWSAAIWAATWKVVPALSVIQFPWRLSGILTVTVAGLFAVATDDCLRHRIGNNRTPSPIVISAVTLAVIGAGNLIWVYLHAFDTPRVDVTRNVDFLYAGYVPAPSLAGFAKLIGASPDSFVVAPTPVQDVVRAEVTSGQCTASIMSLGPRKLRVSAQCQGDARLRIGQLYWPLWRIVPLAPNPLGESLGSSAEGLIEVSLTSGQHDFELVFDGGLPERYGAIVTLVSVLLVIGGFAFAGLSGNRQKPNVT